MFGLLNTYGTDIWNIKLGDIDSQTIISTGDSQKSVANLIMANLPQLIFSFLYVAYNSILTSISLSAGVSATTARVSASPINPGYPSEAIISFPYRIAMQCHS